MRLIVLLFLTFLQGAALAEDVGDELLRPEDAYRLSVDVRDPDTLVATWTIADGYYMYRDKFEFRVDEPGFAFGPLGVPPGKVKHDEFFGDVEIFRNQVSITIPLIRQPDVPAQITLHTRSQGCADLGVCYPPFDQQAALTLPPAPATAATPPAAEASPSPAEASPALAPAAGPVAPLAALKGLARDLGGDDEFLPPDEAFHFSVLGKDAGTVVATWQIADDYYLYRDKFKFAVTPLEGVEIGTVRPPAGKTKHDEFFGDVQIFTGSVSIEVPIVRTDPAISDIRLLTEYQGCADAGICYPPITKTVALSLPPAGAAPPAGQTPQPPAPPTAAPAAAGATASTAGAPPSSQSPVAYQSEQDRIAGTLGSRNVWLMLLTFFGFGLLLAFTPCVFPMIPILSGIIIGQGRHITTRKAFMLSLVYVLAMALTYTVVGVIVGLSGENIQALFQNPWVLTVFAGVFVLLSLSMFGFYDLQMPAVIQSRLTRLSNSQHGGTMAGVAVMGLLSALIVGPCVTAPLIGALIYIAETGDAVLGGLALFSLSLGMGTPLLVLGASAGKLLPKAGPWMDATKAVFGVLMLAVAIWLLERILPMQLTMALSAALLIVSAIYMGAFEGIREGVSGWRRLWKGMGLVMFLYGAALLVGAAGGGGSLLQPLRGMVAPGGMAGSGQPGQAAHGLQFERIKGIDGLQRILARARQEDRPVMLDFYADWCISCKEMEAFTFTDAAVQRALSDAILVQADVTANDALDKALLKRFGLFGPPAIMFFTPRGEELRPYRVVGFMNAESFADHVGKALAQGGQAVTRE